MYNFIKHYGKFILFFLFFGCAKELSKEPIETEDPTRLSGGLATSNDATENAFGNQVNNATNEELDKFENGNSFFRTNWVIAGASTTARDGLGPFLNANSCSACHLLDGRGKPNFDAGLLIRLSVDGTDAHGGPKPDSIYGGQLSTSAIQNVTKESDVTISYTEITGTFVDGETYSLRKPIYTISNLNYGNLEASSMFSPRVGPQVYGLGLLEIIPESAIIENADENDTNTDGISGKANYVWDKTLKSKQLGRFGWKANQPNLLQQTADAFNGDIGITSSINPDENLSGKTQKTNYANLLTGGNPEISDKTLTDVVFYQRSLAVPARRNVKDTDVIKGKKIMTELGCTKCHKERFVTGFSSIPQLSGQTIYPYTDLLLHDMGTDLADNRPDFLASGTEWRTPPLWGIGLIKTVNKHTFLMHDGRARNLTEAILWHGGEAQNAKNNFIKLSKTERQSLINFLENL